MTIKATITDKDRQVFEAHQAGRSAQIIARDLGVSLSAVKQRVAKVEKIMARQASHDAVVALALSHRAGQPRD